MNDRPVSETAHDTRQSIYGRAGLYGALAVASVAGVALAAAAIVTPGATPPVANEAAAPVVEVADAADTVQAGLSSDHPTPRATTEREPEFSAQGDENDAASRVETGAAEPVEEQIAARPLDTDNPRWGNAAAPAATAATRGDPMAAALNALAAENAQKGLPETGAAYVDNAPTSAIASPARQSEPSVAVAESEDEIAALEAAMTGDAGASDPAFASNEAGAAESEMVAARIRSYVNLRGAPSNDAEVYTVVASDTRIRSQPLEACGHFCAVEVDGRAGFIGKSFIAFDQDF